MKEILIDTNTISPVFNKTNADHKEFRPILNALLKKKLAMILGGSRYLKELQMNSSQLKYILELKTAGKIVVKPYSTTNIDKNEKKILKKYPISSSFDDQHIISLLIESKCNLISTKDKRLHPYIRKISAYYCHVGVSYCKKHKPKIYSSISNVSLVP